MMANQWEFSRTTGNCAATGRELAEGESYYAVLFETPEGFERKDYTLEAWSGPPQGSYCYWRARVPVREKKSGPVTVDHTLLTHFFLRLEDEDSQIKQQFRFVLALLLMRKRHLKFERAVREGGLEYWQVRLVREQSEHKVLNPRLSDQEVRQLSEQLTAILNGDAEAIESLGNPNPAGPEREALIDSEGGESSDAN